MDLPNLKKKRISILGCGWLGFPLAKRILDKDISTLVKGSTTSFDKIEKLKESGIESYLINLNPSYELDSESITNFLDSDLLIIAIPPGIRRNPENFHISQINKLLPYIKQSPLQEIIYISSTSVYPDLNRIVTEKDVTAPGDAASKELVATENTITESVLDANVTIVRFGGLLGYDRIPGKYVKGKKDLTTQETPVNYIHRDDAIEALIAIISGEAPNQTFNIVAPIHSKRGEVYTKTCLEFNWPPPTYLVTEKLENYKIVSPQKFQSWYNFKFIYPDPLHFYYKL